MSQLSVIPKQCAALTKKGAQCRKQAILGTSTCSIHAGVSTVVSYFDFPLVKLAAGVVLEATLKIAVEETIKYVVMHHHCEHITLDDGRWETGETRGYWTFSLKHLVPRQLALPAPKEPLLLTAPAPSIPQIANTSV